MAISLTRQQVAQASIYLLTSARPLEWTQYAYYFEGGHQEDILVELAEYQNGDGGFGLALEPDLRIRDSSAICTTLALQIFRDLHTPASNPLVQGAIDYLLHTFDGAHAVWPIIPATANEAPHAPWWHFDGEMVTRWGGFLANPRAEIVGYLYDYAELVPQDWLQQLTGSVLTYLKYQETLEMHELLCFVRLAETATLPEEIRARLLEYLTPLLSRLVVRDIEEWSEYGLKPITVVSSPRSPFAELLRTEIEQNLDYEVFCQMPDGAWITTFSWFGDYPEIWPIAEREWNGIYTLRTLLVLKRFNRLD